MNDLYKPTCKVFTLRVGIEPTASWLTAKRSAPELTKPGADPRIGLFLDLHKLQIDKKRRI